MKPACYFWMTAVANTSGDTCWLQKKAALNDFTANIFACKVFQILGKKQKTKKKNEEWIIGDDYAQWNPFSQCWLNVEMKC